MGMTILFDFILSIVLFFNVFNGLRKGLIRLFFDLISLIGGVFFGFYFYEVVSILLSKWINVSELILTIISFCLIWIGVYLIMIIVGGILNKVIEVVHLSFINRLAGGVFGLIKAAVVVMPVMVPLFYFKQTFVEQSFVIQPVLPFVSFLSDMFVVTVIEKFI